MLFVGDDSPPCKARVTWLRPVGGGGGETHVVGGIDNRHLPPQTCVFVALGIVGIIEVFSDSRASRGVPI